MKRRSFIQLSLVATTLLLTKSKLEAKEIDISKVRFNRDTYEKNKAQTIMIFLYGGASELGANLSNYSEIERASQSSYGYFKGITPTANHFWQEAGGDSLERLLSDGDINIFRTCFSPSREKSDNKSHGICVDENQRGAYQSSGDGIFTTLSRILAKEGVITPQSQLPFIMMEGESGFYAQSTQPLQGFLHPVGVNRTLDNPYEASEDRSWFYYNSQEKTEPNYKALSPAINAQMHTLAQTNNTIPAIKEAFNKRLPLSNFINSLKNKALPSGVSYPSNNPFAQKLQSAIKVLSANPQTKLLSLGSDGLGLWDDHNDARSYVSRMKMLTQALESAMKHIKAEGKEESISIVVWGEFGRNVNLNSALGWDHGNNQNVFILGGKNYYNSVGIVGETTLYNPHKIDRLYLQPKSSSYSFEPHAVAATLYKLYGIENPEVLTGGISAIEGGLLK